MKKILLALVLIGMSGSVIGMDAVELEDNEAVQTVSDAALYDAGNPEEALLAKPEKQTLARRLLHTIRPANWSEATWASVGKNTWKVIGFGAVVTGVVMSLLGIIAATPAHCPEFNWNRTVVPQGWGNSMPADWLVSSCQRDIMGELTNNSCVPIVQDDSSDGGVGILTGPWSGDWYECYLKEGWERSPHLSVACPKQTWFGRLKGLLARNNISSCAFEVKGGVQVSVLPQDKEWVVDAKFYRFIAADPELVRRPQCKQALKEVHKDIKERLPGNGFTRYNCPNYPYETEEYKQLVKGVS